MAFESDAQSEDHANLDYGCGAMVLMAIIMIGLITFNSFLVNGVVDHLMLRYAGFTEFPRLQRGIQIVAPIMMLVFQYWVFDFFRDRLGSSAQHVLQENDQQDS